MRVTGVVATTSRARPRRRAVLGVDLDDAVHVGGGAADVDDDHVTRARVLLVEAAGEQLDTGEHHVGGGAPDHRGEVGPRAEVLAADHVRPGTSRGSPRGRTSGASTPIRGTTLSASTCGTPPRIAATSSRTSTLPATTTGPRQPPATSARAASEQHLGVAAVGPPGQQHHVRPARAPGRGRGVPDPTRPARGGDDVDDLAAAGQRDPAAGLGGDQLLVADHGDAQAAAGAASRPAPRPSAARGSAATSDGQARVVPVEDVAGAVGAGSWWGATRRRRSGPRPGRPAPPW